MQYLTWRGSELYPVGQDKLHFWVKSVNTAGKP